MTRRDAASTVARYKTRTPLSTYFLHLFSFLPLLALSLSAPAATKYWRGGTSTSAKVAANWSDSAAADAAVSSAAPVTGDAIVLDGATDAAQRAMTWDLDDVTISSWTQDGYTNVVTFQTGLSRSANGTSYAAHGVVWTDGVTRVVKVTGDVSLQSGTWTHTANPKPKTTDACHKDGKGIYRLIVAADGDIEIAAAAKISAYDRGFLTYGPGYPSELGTGGNGASHGGETYCALYPSRCYGSVYRPVTIGSGNYNGGACGGGAVWLTAGGTLTMNGTISASTSSGTYASSGGSVLLVAGTIAGSGTIAAKGGDSGYFPGGGGRIALVQTTATDFSAWTGKATALGGNRTDSGNTNRGAAPGTVYFEPADRPYAGDLSIIGRNYWWDPVTARTTDGYYRNCAATLTGRCGETNLTFGTITVSNYGHLGIGTNVVASCRRLLFSTNGTNVATLYGGTLDFRETPTLTNGVFRNFVTGSKVTFASDLAVKTLTFGNKLTGVIDRPLSVLGNLTVAKGATVWHTAVSNTGNTFAINLTVDGDLTVESGGTITAYASGYFSRTSPGAPTAGYGGSHGGQPQGLSGDYCYGSIRRPVTYGSSSNGRADTTAADSPGGGAIRIVASGDATVNGTITARGGNDAYWHGGAGGSVWLSVKTLAGSGSINANGGWCTCSDTGEGGGGRVAVWLTGKDADFSNFSTSRITANGSRKSDSTANKVTSSAGTVYLKCGNEDENEGTLLIQNAGATLDESKMSAHVCAAVTDTDVGRVVITNGGALTISAGSSLTVSKEWQNHARFAAAISSDASVENGAVVFTNAAVEARITGTNTFATFLCATPGKILRFGTVADATETSVSGKFLIAGGDEPVYLKSLADGTYWLLAVSGGATVTDAHVTDSDARLGNAIAATASTDGGHNENWSITGKIVPGAPITWTGNDTSDPTAWTQIANWEPNRVPCETDAVTIPAGCSSYPSLADNTSFNSLTVASGASLNLNSYSLVVTNALNFSGTVIATGGETLTLSGPSATFLGAALSGSPFSLVFSGSLEQSMNPYGFAFKNVTVTKDDGSITFSDAFTADVLTGTFTSPVALKFAATKTVTVNELELDGASGETALLTLACAVGGATWKLNVASYSSVTGVRVGNSDATLGRKIYALKPSENLGGNAGWDFDVSGATWIGASGGAYTNAANWSSGKVPDAATRVFLNGSASAKLFAGDVAVAHSVVATGSGNVLSGTKAKFVVADSLTLEGGSLQLDVPTVVTNAALLRNGATLTHAANDSTDTYGVNLTVLGDMTIDATSKIDAQAKGYAQHYGYPGAYYYEQSGGTVWAGAACGHGGRSIVYVNQHACSDSVFHPTQSGSSTYHYGVGGGKVRLVVGGTLTVDGKVTANARDGDFIAGAGGSVWITTGTLAGSGRISADSGDVYSSGRPWSGGGRVAVELTKAADFSSFSGRMTACGSQNDMESAPRRSSAGTVCRTTADGERTIIVDNEDGWPENATDLFLTDFPVPESMGGDSAKSYRGVKFVVRNGGTFNLTADLTIRDLDLRSLGGTRTNLFLNGHTLTIRDRTHLNGRGWTYLADPGANGQGKVYWQPRPLGIILR